MEITEDTPMTMPSTVRAERTLDERSVSSAARKILPGLRKRHDRH